MANRNSAITFGKQIRTLFDVGALGAMPDRGLLDQFARGGETSEAAFATLVERHGPMVLRVCRQLLADGHLAEDAFQVTFLLLARRARSIHDPDALAGWLHRVARRVALRAVGEVRRRNDRERLGAGEIAVDDDNPLERDELCAIVHEEIDRLGDAHRLPILLCALEGLSHEEAAQRLRWPVGTVKSRLVRGRRRLEGRLARRGLAPALALVAGVAASARLGGTRAAGARRGHDAGRPARRRGHDADGRPGRGVGLPIDRPALAKGVERHVPRQVRARGIHGPGRLRGCRHDRDDAGRPARTPGIQPRSHEARTNEAESPIVPGTDFTSVPKTDRGIPESQPPIPGEKEGNPIVAVPERRLSAFGEQVERAIREGVQFLKAQQQPDGSWADVEADAKTGTTSLVTLALLVGRREARLTHGPQGDSITSAVSAPTTCTALTRSRCKPWSSPPPSRSATGCGSSPTSSGWSEPRFKSRRSAVAGPARGATPIPSAPRPGDNSNTQYALLGLHAASEAGVPVKPAVWELARAYWEQCPEAATGAGRTPPIPPHPTASMTCAGVSSLIISGCASVPGARNSSRAR